MLYRLVYLTWRSASLWIPMNVLNETLNILVCIKVLPFVSSLCVGNYCMHSCSRKSEHIICCEGV